MLSIITPVLNGAKFIEKNIEAIQSLSIPHEHIIVDGGSDDGTLDIISKYSHLKLIHQKEKTGMYGGIHLGFEAAKGKYIAYVNADDTIVKEGFEAMYNLISNQPNTDVVYSDCEFYFINEDRREKIKGRKRAKFFLKKGMMPFAQPSAIYTSQLYQNIGGLRYDKFKICGDLDMFQRMAIASNNNFSYVPKVSTVFLKYGDSLGDRNSALNQKELTQLANSSGKNLLYRLLYYVS